MAADNATMIMAMPYNESPYPIEKLEAHVKGVRHHAISVFIFCGDKMLIQQRALSKYHSGGLWANACCSHPSPDESAEDCARRRVIEELGITVSPVHVGTYDYRADVGGGLIEAEFVDLFIVDVAKPDLLFQLNPDEVADTRWIDHVTLVNELTHQARDFTAWFQIYMTSQDPVMDIIRDKMSRQ